MARITLATSQGISQNGQIDGEKVVTTFSFQTSQRSVNFEPREGIMSEFPAIKRDLLKTVIIIVLALASEIGVYLIVRQGIIPWRI